MNALKKYDYDFCPLPDPAEDLRILKLTLASSSFDADIEGQIVPYDEKTEYCALSWCWGSGTEEKTAMRITHSNEPFHIEITCALASALKRLRRLGVEKRLPVEYLWIDQICINQNDFSERNNQVKLMASIYTRAKLVYVWLGDAHNDGGEYEDTRAAFEFMQRDVLALTSFDKLVRDKNQHKKWDNMVKLLKREWFSRRWVIQEIALARDAMILCGANMIKWSVFADAVSLFNEAEAADRAISAIMRTQEEYKYEPRYFGHVSALGASRLVEVTNDLFRRRADRERVALLSLEQLVCTFTSFDSTEARDTVYAVLAIAKDTMPRTSHENMIAMTASFTDQIRDKFVEQLSKKISARSYYVNYNQPVSDVFVDFVTFSIDQADQTQALDIICRPWAPPPRQKQRYQDPKKGPWRAVYDTKESERTTYKGERAKFTADDGRTYNKLGDDSLPSWIPSSTNAAYGREPRFKRMVRKNADPLVGLPGQRNYSAAGNVHVNKSLSFAQGVTQFSSYEHLNGVHYHSMFVEGFIVDKIQDLRDISQKGNIPEGWADLGRECAHQREQWPNLPEEYWRTLVADRGPNGNPPRHYPRLINHALESHVQDETFHTQEAIDRPECQAVGEVLERVQSVIWNRRLMYSQGRRLGLVPKGALEGDLIVILYGCTVPLILRRFTKTEKEVQHDKATQLTRTEKLAGRTIVHAMRKILATSRARKERIVIESEKGSECGDIDSASRHEASSAPASVRENDALLVDDFGLNEAAGGSSRRPRESDRPLTWQTGHDVDTSSLHTDLSELSRRSQSKSRNAIRRRPTDLSAPGPRPKRNSIYQFEADRPMVHEPEPLGDEKLPASAEESETANKRAADQKPVEIKLKSDEYTFYQVIGECYLHGMMNGEAIPLQRSAEDEMKQKLHREELERVKQAVMEAQSGPVKNFSKSVSRSLTLPPGGQPKVMQIPAKGRSNSEKSSEALPSIETMSEPVISSKPGEEPRKFIRTLFELR